MKTKLQRLKTGRPSPGHLEIDAWVRSQQARLGIDTAGKPAVKPRTTVTVMLPSMDAVTRVAHAAADARIAVDPVYDSMCERLDAELREIIEGCKLNVHPLPRSKSTRAPRVRHVMVND